MKKPKSNKKSSSFDIHKTLLPVINTLFKGRAAVPPGYKYHGPGIPLVFDNKRRKIKKYIFKPTNQVDRIASQHDTCYHFKDKSKNQCDLEMIQKRKNVKNKGIIGVIADKIIKGKYILKV